MSKVTIRRKIEQQKINALAAIQLHRSQIHKLRKRNWLADFLSIAVPVLYLAPRLLARGTAAAKFIDAFGELLAVTLLALAILKLVSKWQDDEIKHAIMARRNADIVYEAERLLRRQHISSEVVEQFLSRIKDVDAEDETLLLDVKLMDRQKAYRDALKQFIPSSAFINCPICGANPWKFKPGNCDACGGTPIEMKD